MMTKATAKFVGTSSRKIGLVAALIRGKSVANAQEILIHANKRATDPVGKVLASALANAQNNHNAKKAELTVESVLVGPAPSLKRMRPRAKGASSAILKRASHITVILTDNQQSKAESPKPKAESKPKKSKTETKPTKKTDTDKAAAEPQKESK